MSRNKLWTRETLKAAGLPTPWFEAVSIGCDAADLARRIPYPAVLKPQALSGSRGVMRVNNVAECVAAFERLRRLLQAPDIRAEQDEAHDGAVIESFIPGAEYAVEGLLTNGRLQLLALFDKPDPLDGPFFEETIYVTPSAASVETQRRIGAAVADAAAAIGLHHGPVHAECRVNGDEVYVIETAGRPIGGLCSRALRFAARTSPARETVSLEEVLLCHALGEDVSCFEREDVASGVMMIPIPRRGIFRGVEGVDEARAIPHVEDVRITAKADAALVPLPEGRSYLGFIFARAAAPHDVDAALRRAHACLRFAIDREVALVP